MPRRLPTFALCILLFAFSWWLMFHTFWSDPVTGNLKVAGKVWSDFGNALPLIRSFSFGHNWPPQYPLYPGEPIRYHFLFYFGVGLLERLGLPLAFAFNLPSIFGFFLLLVLIYLISLHLFRSRVIAVLAIVFFLFNGSLSFIKYFTKNGVTLNSFISIPHTTAYPTFGPWDGNPIAAIWNLNIYTNQRHLAFSIALGLLGIYICLLIQQSLSISKKLASSIALALLLGLLTLTNQAIFASLLIFLFWFFLFRPATRFAILFSLLFSIPLFLYSRTLVNFSPSLQVSPGFLLSGPLTVQSFISYWFHNLGFHLILIPLGLLLAPPKWRWLALPLATLFIVPNYFRLSTDMFNNHKLFNFFLIFGNMFTAYALVWIWRHHSLLRLYPLILLFLLTFSGIIDFFALANDGVLTLSDIKTDPDIRYFLLHTPPNAVVANSYWFYHPASLAGRPIFSGYTYFTWSHGYDQTLREHQQIAIYRSPTKAMACSLLHTYHISYVELKDHPEEYLKPNYAMWNSDFTPEYQNPDSGLKVYNVSTSCPH